MKKRYMKLKKFFAICLLLTFIAPVCNCAMNNDDGNSVTSGIETYFDFPFHIDM